MQPVVDVRDAETARSAFTFAKLQDVRRKKLIQVKVLDTAPGTEFIWKTQRMRHSIGIDAQLHPRDCTR
jgi:hypothetical protein